MDTRAEVIKLIEILGYPYSELVVDLHLSDFNISSIAYIKETDVIMLYKWSSEYEFQYNFDELSIKDQKFVYLELSKFILN